MDAPKKYKAPHLTTGAKKYAPKRMYDTVDWAQYRVKFIAHNPKCYACGEPSRVVDHIESAKGREEVFWKEGNYLPLCKPCHAYITAKFDRHATADLRGKLNWINEKRAQTGTTVRVKIVPLD